MRKKTVSTMALPAAAENFEALRLFIRNRLDAEGISREIISETMLVFEALFHNLREQGLDESTTMQLSCRNSFGNINIKIAFEGKPMYLYVDSADGLSPENQILQAYEDRIDLRYRSGYNTFQISVKRRLIRSLLLCGAGALLALLAYLPIRLWMPAAEQTVLRESIIIPLERCFGNAALMIGAPVTFFSLLKNLTDTYILSERFSGNRRLQAKAFCTSLVSALLAVGMGCLLFSDFRFHSAAESASASLTAAEALAQLISEAVPASIFEPFESLSPIPLLLMALIVTISFCSSGKYFESLKKAVDMGYAVFSLMLGLVMFVLPFSCFLASLDLLIRADFGMLPTLVQGGLLILASLPVLAVFYLIRLRLGGVRLGPFLRKLPPLLAENFRIGSAIDAVPYNIRFCTRHYGMDRKRLERNMPLLARINLDGNCYLLMIIAIFFSYALGTGAAWHQIAVLALLVVLLSIGAPNQPGSILIGTLILLKHQGVTEAANLAIFMEVVFGVLQNIINVTGDIVTASIEERRHAAPEKEPHGIR